MVITGLMRYSTILQSICSPAHVCILSMTRTTYRRVSAKHPERQKIAMQNLDRTIVLQFGFIGRAEPQVFPPLK